MGWTMYGSKPQIYSFPKGDTSATTRYSEVTNPHYFTWAAQSLWTRYEYAVRYVNDTDGPMSISKLSIKTCACDSGGQSYWSSTGLIGACKGYGATYFARVRVSNDGEASYQSSDIGEHVIPTISQSNMNSPGSSTSNTAVFGQYPYGSDPYSIYTGLVGKDFDIDNCPMIEPGGVAYVHIGITDFLGSNCQFQFVLDPAEMGITVETGKEGYVWRYYADEKKWHLVRPLYVYRAGKGWLNAEGE